MAVAVACMLLIRYYCSPVRSGKDSDRGNRGVDDKEELPRAVHERCQRAAVEVPVSGAALYESFSYMHNILAVQ